MLSLLEVRCGTADKSHENRFFRYFASQVKDYFEKIGIDGILVGMPECKVRDNLQMDALLITDSSLTIIDFKDYDNCVVNLPDDSDFERGQWTTDKDFYVRGGSSRNPYAQLMRQRGWLKEILDRFCRHKVGDFDATHITSMVCFTGNITIHGGIPGWAKLKFFIADAESFLGQLYDIANVRSAGLLQSDFATNMFDRLFEAQPFECDIKPNSPFETSGKDEPLLAITSEHVIESSVQDLSAIQDFFASEDDILIVSSISSSERAALALAAQEQAHDADFRDALILSSTKLAGDNLCVGLPLDGSVYHEIYDFSSRTKDKNGIDHIGLSTASAYYSLRYDDEATFPAGEAHADPVKADYRIAFIVCESQLVSSSAWLDGPVVFGSGRLLDDILSYLSINGDNKGRNKVVFIGDDCQLGANSYSASSMHKEAYPQDLSVATLSIPFVKACQDCTELQMQLASSIREEDTSLLCIDPSSVMPRIASREEEPTLIEDASTNWRTHKIIAYTNEQANQLNRYIKRSVIRNGNNLCAGDVLLFNGQFEAVACDPLQDEFPTRPIRNGEFATVTSVSGLPLVFPIVSSAEDEDESFLTLIPIRFVPEGSTEEYEALVIKEYLEAPKAELSDAQEIAIRIRLDEIEREERERTVFGPGNPWFEAMVREGNYYEQTDPQGVKSYRLASDHRKLTPHEEAYRRETLRRLNSPGTEYYRIANAARARFGWAVTAHKAQSYYWDDVTLSASAQGLGRHSTQYFRFLYTGASRARHNLSIVRWKDVTPFDETHIVSSPDKAQPSTQKRALFQVGDTTPAETILAVLEELDLGGATISHVGSSNYQERFEINRDEQSVTVAFSYNKKNEVGSPVRQKGDTELFLDVKNAIEVISEPASNSTRMTAAYRYLVGLLGEGASIKVTRCTAYRDELAIEVNGDRCAAAAYYNSKGLVTRLDMLSGSREAFEEVARAIERISIE